MIVFMLALCGCAADTSKPAASGPPPSYDGAAYAKQVQDAVLEGLTTNEYQRPATFADMCQTTVGWACAIAKIESESPGSVKVTLAPEDVWLARWDGPERASHEIGGRIALNLYDFAQASGVTSLHQVDVYRSNGELSYLSPPSFGER